MDEQKTVMTNLEPPRDIESEAAVLGSMMQSSEAVSDVIAMLKESDFYLKEHSEIYKAFLKLHAQNIGIDLMTTYSQLQRMNTDALVGGMTYLSRLSSSAIEPKHAKYYAESVISKSQMRRLINEADTIKSQAYSGERSPEEILDFAEQRIFQIAQGSQKRNYEDINEVISRDINKIREIAKNKGELPGIPTGFKDLDKMLNGLQKTDLIILAARPGMGKTAFALNVAENAAKEGHAVLIFSLEMSADQLGMRMLSMTAKVDNAKLKTGNLSTEDWRNISMAQDEFEDLNITIDDASDISMLELKNKCRRCKSDKGLDLIVIDYLQLMSMGGYGIEQREKEISALTRNLKILAKELDCAVIVLSQLSRKTESEKSKRPQLSHLRDSGSIEQDADIVIFLKRDDYYENEDDAATATSGMGNLCEVIIAKHRNGETGSINLTWLPKYTAFGNSEYSNVAE